jgi:hypothetical protein
LNVATAAKMPIPATAAITLAMECPPRIVIPRAKPARRQNPRAEQSWNLVSR